VSEGFLALLQKADFLAELSQTVVPLDQLQELSGGIPDPKRLKEKGFP
jgi:hypothetical protein